MDFEYLKVLKELVVKVSGKDTAVLVDILKNEKPVNEFKIAEKLGLTINQVRNILYKLYNQNIVAFVRKKDEKKGWYIYSWSINIPKAFERLKIMKEKELHELRHLLSSRENKRFFKCPRECVELNEESAMLHDFTCAECGSILALNSTEELTNDVKIKIDIIKHEINEIESELNKRNEVRLVKLEKERERIAKEKKRKRMALKKAAGKLKKPKIKASKKHKPSGKAKKKR